MSEPKAPEAESREAGRSHPEHEVRGKDITLSLGEFERLTQLAKQVDQCLRQVADVENLRKRLQRDREEFGKYANEGLIRQLLPIVDSLDQALRAAKQQPGADAMLRGVELISRQLMDVLARAGVTRIDTVGKPFDPHQHDAVAQVKTDDHQADGTIVEEVQVGYLMHGKLLRPAMVKVAATTQSPEAQEDISNG
jgi:molecular chaperone GrpE